MTGGVDSSADVLLATSGYDHTIRFWQAHSGISLRTLQHPDSQVNCLAFSPDRAVIAAAGHQHVRMYDVNSSNPNPVVNYDGMSKNVMECGFQCDGNWMWTAGEDKTVKIWDLRAPRVACQRMYQVDAPVNCAVLHPNQGEIILGDANGAIHVWDLRNDDDAMLLNQLKPDHDASIQSLAINQDANYLSSVNNKGDVYVWVLSQSAQEHAATLTPKTKISAHQKYGLKCRFSPDSCLMATTAADCSVKIWNTADWSLRQTLSCEGQRWVWDAQFSADSNYIVTASSEGNARLWSVDDGDVRRTYSGHQKAIVCLAFHDNSPHS